MLDLRIIHLRIERKEDVAGVERRKRYHVPLGTVHYEGAHDPLPLLRRVEEAEGTLDVAHVLQKAQGPVRMPVVVTDGWPATERRQSIAHDLGY